MNVTESKVGSLIKMCPMNEMVWKQEYQVERIAFAMTAIILNILSFPVTILMNMLVIMAVKTRPRLQNKYNIYLRVCLAGTDLLVGAASQPTFIAGQIYSPGARDQLWPSHLLRKLANFNFTTIIPWTLVVNAGVAVETL